MSIIFQPLILVGIDFYEHTFHEANHILTVHIKYGANHLQKEIADTNNDDSNNQNSTKSEDSVQPHIVAEEMTKSFSVSNLSTQQFVSLNVSKFKSEAPDIQLPPPKQFTI